MKNKLNSVYFGIFLISFATLFYEILITRIFSVTLIYHFAFLVVSIALLGMTIGANYVYLNSKTFEKKDPNLWLGLLSMLFGISIIVSFFVQMNLHFSFATPKLNGYVLIANFVVTMIPFIFSGVAISLAISAYLKNISKIYASDLVGASLGCIFLIIVVDIFGAQNSVVFVAVIALAASVVFSKGSKLFRYSIGVFLGSVIFLFISLLLSQKGNGLFEIKYAKGLKMPTPLYEAWNSYSRVTVNEFEDYQGAAGLSKDYKEQAVKAEKLHMRIDADAYTPLLRFDGNLEKQEYLKHDLANLVHHIKNDADVLIIGSGGGRDVVSALVFNQKQITGVEINNAINHAVKEVFADYVGNLDSYENVSFVTDEARSYISSHKQKHDVIQISLIDTWAATAAGAYVLSENSLYTIEAWNNYIAKLSDDGVLSVARWYVSEDPLELYRLVSLASSSLKNSGITNPEKHLVLTMDRNDIEEGTRYLGIVSLLLKKSEFTTDELQKINKTVEENGFKVLYSSETSTDPTLEKIIQGKNINDISNSLKANIEAPTDDKPFFFNMLRVRDIFDKNLSTRRSINFNLTAVSVLVYALIIITILSVTFIIIPLKINASTIKTKKLPSMFLYFTSIGFGYMLIEISLMQRMNIFLGHPVYSLSVVLFTLLLSSGLGSYITSKLQIKSVFKQSGQKRIVILLLVLAVVGFVSSGAVQFFQGYVSVVRIIIAVILIFPLGYYMGMQFPIGMKLAEKEDKNMTPWLWGINGCASVYASVFAVILAMSVGISATYWIGLLFYGLTLVSFKLIIR